MKRARICILLALTLVFVLGFGSTALAEEGEGEILAETLTHNPPQSPYDLTFTINGDCKITTEYAWTISKTSDLSAVSIKPGESADVKYTITAEKTMVNETAEENVSSSIGIDTHNGNKVKVVVQACVKEDGTPIPDTIEDLTSDWSSQDRSINYNPAFTPKTGSSYEIVYTGKCWLWGDGSKDINESLSITVNNDSINGTINVTDTVSSGLPSSITSSYGGGGYTFSDSGSQEYTVTFENVSQTSGTFTVTNTAKIDETQYEALPVDVTVKVPKKSSGDPEPREERKVRWPDRTPPPEELESASVELPHTGGFLEWEWIALAGGMLASGGGALYLVRRRKMKK